MVASIAKMSRGIETYYTQLAREDYYLKGGEPPGQWVGKAAKQLGLGSLIQEDDLKNVLAGFDSNGQNLVRNAGKENRQVGWDVAFSAPKDVSILWGIGTEQQRAAIEQAHNKAVAKAIEYIQKNAIWSRTGAGGTKWQKAEAVVATFLHGTSRDVDPNLHTHALFANTGVRADGTTGTIVSKKLYENKMIAGLIYRATLAEHLSQHCGLKLNQVKSWFEVEGISSEAREFFSKRSQTIKAAVGKNATQAEKDQATLQTRSVKGHVARSEVYPKWQREALKFGLDQQKINQIFGNKHRAQDRGSDFSQLQAQAVDRLETEQSFFSSNDLLRRTLEKMKMGADRIDSILEQHQASLESDQFKRLGEDQKTEFFASQAQQKEEAKLLKLSKALRREPGRPVSQAHVKAVIEGNKLSKVSKQVEAYIHEFLPKCLRFKFTSDHFRHLNSEQKKALFNITTTGGKLHAFSGRAGTGKTTLLSAAREVWESKGYHVVGCAVSGKAAQELAQGAGINSETVTMRLLQLDSRLSNFLTHEAKQLLRAFIGKNRQNLEQFKLTKKSVLVIDEASMLPNHQLTRLLKHANRAGAKVVLAGDVRQLPSIEAGGGFARIFKETAGIELTKIVRQKTEWLRDAVGLFAEDDTRGALSKFVAAGRLAFMKDKEELRDELLETWNKQRTKDLKESVILAATNEDVDVLNQKAQDIRRRNGELDKSSFTWGKVKYFQNDRITFHQNNRKLGVWNGDAGTIKTIINPLNSWSVRFVVELDRGGTVMFSPRDFKEKTDISLGYASTIHKSQGMTVDKSFLMLDPKVNKEPAYVGLTRSRMDAFVYCETDQLDEDTIQQWESQEKLGRSIDRSQQKQLATDKRSELEEERARHQELERRKQLQMQHNHVYSR